MVEGLSQTDGPGKRSSKCHQCQESTTRRRQMDCVAYCVTAQYSMPRERRVAPALIDHHLSLPGVLQRCSRSPRATTHLTN
ncbi:hypothetical protein FOMPIDRAFT_1044110 [Fomitopsis schrenkii]|uniref:Uncharacterized protein n=1 Tax=Fomitopsis schrenkii TaxID=2126942 RepID=S8DM61_FOMSC|nr:hypothetical protein FOMPIDRAFT_1044110 [Fomitopsis schrenkii]